MLINSSFPKCEIRKNNIYGRYVVAAKDIRAGEVILQEEPAVIVPQWDTSLCCSNCFKKSETICNYCHIFPLCMNCSHHNEYDCGFFRDINHFNKNFFLEHFATFGPIKCLLLMENPSTKEEIWRKFIELEAHMEERRGKDIWQEHKKNVIEPIMKSGLYQYFQNEKVNEEFLQRICGILDVNTFEVRGPEGKFLRGIYLNADLLAHNCTANTMIAVDEVFNMKIYATMNLKGEEIIHYNYTNPLLGTKERQTILKFGKYFECQCKRCNDPTELGTYLSAVACTACNDDGLILYHHNIETWKCNKCSKTVTNSDVQNIITKVNEEIQEAGNDLRKLEMIIQKYEKILNRQHYLIIDIKQNIASILRTICMNQITKPGNLILKRKIQLCEEILIVLRILQPGISRLTAIALYEYYTPLVDLAQREYENFEITKDEFIKKLQNCERILKESTEMLLYEPNCTPEGQLARRAMIELKELRETMKELEEDKI